MVTRMFGYLGVTRKHPWRTERQKPLLRSVKRKKIQGKETQWAKKQSRQRYVTWTNRLIIYDKFSEMTRIGKGWLDMETVVEWDGARRPFWVIPLSWVSIYLLYRFLNHFVNSIYVSIKMFEVYNKQLKCIWSESKWLSLSYRDGICFKSAHFYFREECLFISLFDIWVPIKVCHMKVHRRCDKWIKG